MTYNSMDSAKNLRSHGSVRPEPGGLHECGSIMLQDVFCPWMTGLWHNPTTTTLSGTYSDEVDEPSGCGWNNRTACYRCCRLQCRKPTAGSGPLMCPQSNPSYLYKYTDISGNMYVMLYQLRPSTTCKELWGGPARPPCPCSGYM